MNPEESRLATGQRHLPLILASASPRRRDLLRSVGLSPRVVPSETDETVDPSLSPDAAAVELATRKARSVAEMLRRAGETAGVVLGADTVVCIDGELLGKPADAEDAARMLAKLQGREHRVYTGVCLLDVAGTRQKTGCRETAVRMKPLSPERIRRYVATGECFDKAGAYAVQGLGALLVESIRGCYYNVVGLPLSLVDDLLAEFGMETMIAH
jgi:septum formation protein